MGELIPTICIHEMEPSILSSILNAAYSESDESPESLVLLTNATNRAFGSYTYDSITRPTVDASFESPFIGWDVDRIMQFLEENATDTIVCDTLFLIADQQTDLDKTLLLVDATGIDADEGEEQEIFKVRVAAKFANVEAVSVSVGVTDGGEIQALVDEDGIYRGGPNRHALQKLGGYARPTKF